MSEIRQPISVKPDPFQRRSGLTHIPELRRLNDRRLEYRVLISRLRHINNGRDLPFLTGIPPFTFRFRPTGNLYRRLGKRFPKPMGKSARVIHPHSADEADARVIPSHVDLAFESALEYIVNLVGESGLPSLHRCNNLRHSQNDTTFRSS